MPILRVLKKRPPDIEQMQFHQNAEDARERVKIFWERVGDSYAEYKKQNKKGFFSKSPSKAKSSAQEEKLLQELYQSYQDFQSQRREKVERDGELLDDVDISYEDFKQLKQSEQKNETDFFQNLYKDYEDYKTLAEEAKSAPKTVAPLEEKSEFKSIEEILEDYTKEESIRRKHGFPQPDIKRLRDFFETVKKHYVLSPEKFLELGELLIVSHPKKGKSKIAFDALKEVYVSSIFFTHPRPNVMINEIIKNLTQLIFEENADDIANGMDIIKNAQRFVAAYPNYREMREEEGKPIYRAIQVWNDFITRDDYRENYQYYIAQVGEATYIAQMTDALIAAKYTVPDFEKEVHVEMVMDLLKFLQSKKLLTLEIGAVLCRRTPDVRQMTHMIKLLAKENSLTAQTLEAITTKLDDTQVKEFSTGLDMLGDKRHPAITPEIVLAYHRSGLKKYFPRAISYLKGENILTPDGLAAVEKAPASALLLLELFEMGIMRPETIAVAVARAAHQDANAQAVNYLTKDLTGHAKSDLKSVITTLSEIADQELEPQVAQKVFEKLVSLDYINSNENHLLANYYRAVIDSLLKYQVIDNDSLSAIVNLKPAEIVDLLKVLDEFIRYTGSFKPRVIPFNTPNELYVLLDAVKHSGLAIAQWIKEKDERFSSQSDILYSPGIFLSLVLAEAKEYETKKENVHLFISTPVSKPSPVDKTLEVKIAAASKKSPSLVDPNQWQEELKKAGLSPKKHDLTTICTPALLLGMQILNKEHRLDAASLHWMSQQPVFAPQYAEGVLLLARQSLDTLSHKYTLSMQPQFAVAVTRALIAGEARGFQLTVGVNDKWPKFAEAVTELLELSKVSSGSKAEREKRALPFYAKKDWYEYAPIILNVLKAAKKYGYTLSDAQLVNVFQHAEEGQQVIAALEKISKFSSSAISKTSSEVKRSSLDAVVFEHPHLAKKLADVLINYEMLQAKPDNINYSVFFPEQGPNPEIEKAMSEVPKISGAARSDNFLLAPSERERIIAAHANLAEKIVHATPVDSSFVALREPDPELAEAILKIAKSLRAEPVDQLLWMSAYAKYKEEAFSAGQKLKAYTGRGAMFPLMPDAQGSPRQDKRKQDVQSSEENEYKGPKK